MSERHEPGMREQGEPGTTEQGERAMTPEQEAAPAHLGYLFLGGVFLVASVPAWVTLATGSLLASRNPYLLPLFLGTPVGGLLLVFGTRRIPPNSRSRTAVRFAILSLAFLVMALGSELGVRAGFQPLKTSFGFCVMAASYLALATLVFLIRALAVRGAGSGAPAGKGDGS